MKKLTKEYEKKSVADMEKEVSGLRAEIAKIRLESRVTPQKDTNAVRTKKKRIASLLTMINDRRMAELMSRESSG